MREAEDFRTEVATLHALLADEPAETFALVTQFKGWTVDDVLAHLHLFDVAARLSLTDEAAFHALFEPIAADLLAGRSLRDAHLRFMGDERDGASGPALLALWRDEAERLADLYAATDPKRRVPWAGPSMSARSAVTARQMEVWAHGHEVFDRLGAVREEGERIANICHLGVVTYGWTFANRDLAPPGPRPPVRLAAPSGRRLDWEGEPDAAGRIEGPAVAFAQVVTQTRSPADVDLIVEGEAARAWMRHAQCFAGPPVDPPAPGARGVTPEA